MIISKVPAGHYAAIGMTPLQWARAAAAVLGSVTLAVAVRVWPLPEKAKAPRASGLAANSIGVDVQPHGAHQRVGLAEGDLGPVVTAQLR